MKCVRDGQKNTGLYFFRFSNFAVRIIALNSAISF